MTSSCDVQGVQGRQAPDDPPSLTTIELVMPYVGRPDYLRAAVHSVLSQDHPEWRLTVVEDGPQGHGVAEWVAGLDDPRVRHVLNPVNLGVARNFQRCLELADADWVVLVGCDDLLLPTYVTTVLDAIGEFPDAAAVLPGVDVIDESGSSRPGLADRVKAVLAPRTSGATGWRGDQILASLLHGNWSYFPSICWRRDVVASFGFRADLDVTLDLALMAELLMSREQIVTLPEVVFSYRRHAASASSHSARHVHRFWEEARLFQEIAERCTSLGWTRAARAARWHLTSRLHALSLVTSPGTSPAARRALVRHTFAR